MEAAVIGAIVMGVVATLATDLWARLLQVAGLPLTNWALVGRWVAWFSRGVFVHRPIGATAEVRGELLIGWAFHYAIGAIYAALYLAIMEVVAGSGPTVLSALAFGIATLVAPWFIMQPALGLGFMAALTPRPAVVRAINVSAHTVFGMGLYLGFVVGRHVGVT